MSHSSSNVEDSAVLNPAATPELQIKALSFAYKKEKVLTDIDLELNSGEFIGIIGPNGSGKSTLMKHMGGILLSPSENVIYQGRPINDYPKKALAQSIAWIPQEHPMVFPFRVSEVVLMGRHPYMGPLRFESVEDHNIASEAMEMTRTLQFAHRPFNQISSGEKQRVMIASAIAQRPQTMLLDEPTSALDIKFQIEILNILKSLNENSRRTILISIHDLHLASKYCNRLILLKQGQIVKDGLPKAVLQKETLESVYETPVCVIPNTEDDSLLISPL